jgi:hypothetical protein
LSRLLEPRRHRIAGAALALALAICCVAAWAEESGQGEADAAVASAPPARPERFSGVTATTGREWVEQCDGAAQKSDSTVRVGACVSFLQGARAVATRSNGKECDVDLARQTRGDVWISTFQIARRYPALPIRKVFGLAFDAIEPDSCRKRS